MKRIAVLVAPLTLLTGCASWFIHGGELVGANYQSNVVVSYRADGTVPAGATYKLVKTPDGKEAVFEQSADGSGTLITNQWRENEEDHFFCWVGSSHGYEYVIPVDRAQAGRKYVYPAGYFSVKKDASGVERPDCPVELDPVATLIPE